MATQKSTAMPWVENVFNKGISTKSSETVLRAVVLEGAAFVQMLRFERRRTERSGRQFMLVLLNSKEFGTKLGSRLINGIAKAIGSNTRETDVLGWYEQDLTLGLLMTEIGLADATTVETVSQKISDAVRNAVSPASFDRLKVTARLFPQISEKQVCAKENLTFYPDLTRCPAAKKQTLVTKGVMDVIGSIIALILFLPAIVIIALLVKLTSKGPIIFCQTRVGQYGKEFCFLKFRTMYVDNDSRIHQNYVSDLIAGKDDVRDAKGIYKLVDDPRITPVGRFLRRTSLDELPQFVNILRCDMSLVGPRPPLPYEYERYQIWHKRRVLELKPGLTGLWQVEGRSRTNFNEMVRMDLRYAKARSFWVDCKILLQTPAAMVSGRGAC
ncbi:sugar transferase [Granulicella sp. dw_53]|uniref:sugar transferase n=1 Tax=Granulicella sp. dw_53 TaxID=2719792 RepID=UPI001BD1CDFD|nr:sugar transferase [Granulicella sp. dw_53]